MTNHERYKQAFSALHASDDISLEGKPMKKAHVKFCMKPVFAVCLCALLVIGGASAAYAADLGGIQETIRVWLRGKQVEAEVTYDPHASGAEGYAFTVSKEDGSTDTFGAGGVAIEGDGRERPLTPEEVADGFATQVETDENGRVWLYHYDKAFDITDLMENGACKVSLEEEGKTLYFDIEDNHAGGNRFGMNTKPTGSAADYTALK